LDESERHHESEIALACPDSQANPTRRAAGAGLNNNSNNMENQPHLQMPLYTDHDQPSKNQPDSTMVVLETSKSTISYLKSSEQTQPKKTSPLQTDQADLMNTSLTEPEIMTRPEPCPPSFEVCSSKELAPSDFYKFDLPKNLAIKKSKVNWKKKQAKLKKQRKVLPVPPKSRHRDQLTLAGQFSAIPEVQSPEWNHSKSRSGEKNENLLLEQDLDNLDMVSNPPARPEVVPISGKESEPYPISCQKLERILTSGKEPEPFQFLTRDLDK
jgi:hypothetical protein